MTDTDLDLVGCKVLVVDDVPANLDVLFQALDGEGYNIHVASDGETALEVAEHSRPDLILLDVMMPGIDGYETCRRLKGKETVADTPVIFLTARDDLEGIVEGFQSGGADYVTKPFKKEEVLARARTHLERALLARNLADINTRLEDLVAERTRQLQLRVRELEGKDRITEHLLAFHSLEDALGLVLEVVADILDAGRAVVHLHLERGEEAASAIEVSESGVVRIEPDAELPTERQELLSQIREGRGPALTTGKDPCRAAVPVLRDDELLGIIEVESRPGGRGLDEADLKTLASFALQAAVAIQDAQIRQDPEAWADQLDEVLELDGELQEADQLEELSDELDA